MHLPFCQCSQLPYIGILLIEILTGVVSDEHLLYCSEILPPISCLFQPWSYQLVVIMVEQQVRWFLTFVRSPINLFIHIENPLENGTCHLLDFIKPLYSASLLLSSILTALDAFNSPINNL